MPCWQVNIITVEFKAAHRELLLKALKQLNFGYDTLGSKIVVGQIEIDLESQSVTIRGNSLVKQVNKIKRAYSEQVILEVARRKKIAVRRKAKKFVLTKY